RAWLAGVIGPCDVEPGDVGACDLRERRVADLQRSAAVAPDGWLARLLRRDAGRGGRCRGGDNPSMHVRRRIPHATLPLMNARAFLLAATFRVSLPAPAAF